MALLNEAVTTTTTGHVAWSNQAAKKLNGAWFDVKADFGATGDGATNDRTAIQAAITAAEAAAGYATVYFPPGVYAIGSARRRAAIRSGRWHRLLVRARAVTER